MRSFLQNSVPCGGHPVLDIFNTITELGTIHFFHDYLGNKDDPTDIKGNTEVGEKTTVGFLWNLLGWWAPIDSNTS